MELMWIDLFGFALIVARLKTRKGAWVLDMGKPQWWNPIASTRTDTANTASDTSRHSPRLFTRTSKCRTALAVVTTDLSSQFYYGRHYQMQPNAMPKRIKMLSGASTRLSMAVVECFSISNRSPWCRMRPLHTNAWNDYEKHDHSR